MERDALRLVALRNNKWWILLDLVNKTHRKDCSKVLLVTVVFLFSCSILRDCFICTIVLDGLQEKLNVHIHIDMKECNFKAKQHFQL